MQETLKKEIGRRIRKVRESRELTQTDVAQILGMNRSNLSRMEIGEVMPTADTLVKLRKFLGISSDWLLTGEGVMDKPAVEILAAHDEDVRELLESMADSKRLKHAVLEFGLTYIEKFLKLATEIRPDDNGREDTKKTFKTE